MQLFALDGGGTIFADGAVRGKNYLCPECSSPVRLRGGPHRQSHFYHLAAHSQCRQHKKTLEHIKAQLYLHALLPGSRLENRFPEMGRIADVYWEKEKIVYEIQCSPISLEEARNRCEDYRRLGIKLVWVLHEKRFNKKKLSAAENYLRTTPCYFTDIGRSGKGTVYDQFEICKRAKRLFKGPPLKVALDRPMAVGEMPSDLPQAIGKVKERPVYFQGDLVDRYLASPSESMKNWEEKFYTPPKKRGFSLKKFYTIMLRFFLERLSA